MHKHHLPRIKGYMEGTKKIMDHSRVLNDVILLLEQIKFLDGQLEDMTKQRDEALEKVAAYEKLLKGKKK